MSPTASRTTLIVADKFRGPPNSGNGGYVAGVLAEQLASGRRALPNGDAIEVTLRAPTPLNEMLTLEQIGELQETKLVARHGATLIAEALITTLRLEVPTRVTWDEAMSVRTQSYSFPVGINTLFAKPLRGVHPICFCCGAEPASTEGAHVYAAPFDPKQQVAAAWLPTDWLADEQGFVKPEFIWTALDCPGQMAWRARGIQTGMLGRLTARIDKRVRANERCVVTGWTLENEGKKYFAGTALFNEAGELCASAKAVWIGRVN